MKTKEFSDMFDTLLNSYNTQANFGEGASKAEIALDEYEKSVLLTLALDIVVKSYFDRNLNSQGLGFDDSTRRQVDFSSLIKTKTLEKAANQSSVFDNRGIIFRMPTKTVGDITTTDVLFILNEKLIVNIGKLQNAYWYKEGHLPVQGGYTDSAAATLPYTGGSAYTNIADAEASGWRWVAPRSAETKEFVVVPLNYKEYDRENSKAYAQPLKKQAWRLFLNQSTEFDVYSELIPIWSISEDIKNTSVSATYKIRYVQRPDPIVLINLPDGLSIDGITTEKDCTLNPILHMDILNKAVELAIATRGYNTKNVQQATDRA